MISGVDKLTPAMAAGIKSVAGLGDAAVSAAGKGESGIQRLVKHFTSLTGIVQVFAASKVLGGIFDSFGEAAKVLDQVGQAATRLELSVEQVSKVRYLAEAAGAPFDAFVKGVAKAEERIGEFVRTGQGPAREALSQLHLRLVDADGTIRSIVDILPELAIQMEKVGTRGERMSIADQLFGSADDDFLKILNVGAERLEGFSRQASALNVIWSPEQVRRGTAYVSALSDVRQAWLGVKVAVFDQIGPVLVEGLETAARVLAVVPQIVGTLAGNIRAAFAGGEVGEGIRRDFSLLFEQIGAVAGAGVRGIARIVLVESVRVAGAVWQVLGPDIKAGLARLAVSAVEEMFQQIFKVLDKLGLNVTSHLVTMTGIFATAKYDINEFYGAGGDVGKAFNTVLSDSTKYSKDLASAWADMRTELGQTAGAAFETADRILGLSEAWAKTGVNLDDVKNKIRGVREQQRGVDTGFGFFDGMRKGAEDLARTTGDVYQQGVQFYGGLANTISGPLSSALVSTAGDVRNLGKYFREFFSSTLQGVSQLISQMLVLRLVSGIGSSLLGGGVSSTAGAVPVLHNPLEGAGGVVLGNRGGMVTRGGIKRFARGGPVGGFDLGRDSVLAGLRPREFVLNQSAAARAGMRALQNFNAGGAVPAAIGGGGGGIHVSVTVNVSGGGGGSREGSIGNGAVTAIKGAVLQGLLEALNGSASGRERLRAALA